MALFVQGRDKWKGDPAVACESLAVSAQTADDMQELARLYRLLSNPDTRERLLELAERVEEGDRAALDPAFA